MKKRMKGMVAVKKKNTVGPKKERIQTRRRDHVVKHFVK